MPWSGSRTRASPSIHTHHATTLLVLAADAFLTTVNGSSLPLFYIPGSR